MCVFKYLYSFTRYHFFTWPRALFPVKHKQLRREKKCRIQWRHADQERLAWKGLGESSFCCGCHVSQHGDLSVIFPLGASLTKPCCPPLLEDMIFRVLQRHCDPHKHGGNWWNCFPGQPTWAREQVWESRCHALPWTLPYRLTVCRLGLQLLTSTWGTLDTQPQAKMENKTRYKAQYEKLLVVRLFQHWPKSQKEVVKIHFHRSQ